MSEPHQRFSQNLKRPPSLAQDVDANGVLAVASRIASLEDRKIRERYHFLIDKKLEGQMTALERFELERINTRLDAEDRDLNLEASDEKWELERRALLGSIEDLLSKLKK